MKCRGGKSQRREEKRREERRSKKRKSQERESLRRKKIQTKEDPVARKGRKVAKFFQWFVAPEGRKVGSLKQRVRSQLARWEMKSCTPLWREAHFQVKMYKTHQVRITFWKLRCRKSERRCGAKHISKSKCTKHTGSGPLLEVEMSKKCTPLWREDARSTFASEKVKNTTRSEHFWKLWCRKSARRCGTEHISKSKCTKHTILGPLLEVEMSKKCTLLWRSTFRSQNVKNTGLQTLLEVQMSFRVAGALDCGPCQKWAKRDGF